MKPAIIELRDEAFNEIADEMIRTGHEDEVIFEADRSVTLNMHGIVIIRKASNVVEFPKRDPGPDVDNVIRNSLPDILKGFE